MKLWIVCKPSVPGSSLAVEYKDLLTRLFEYELPINNWLNFLRSLSTRLTSQMPKMRMHIPIIRLIFILSLWYTWNFIYLPKLLGFWNQSSMMESQWVTVVSKKDTEKVVSPSMVNCRLRSYESICRSYYLSAGTAVIMFSTYL